jgi:hypothetical protein
MGDSMEHHQLPRTNIRKMVVKPMDEKEARIADDLKDIGIVDELVVRRVVRYIRLKMLIFLFAGMVIGVIGFIGLISLLVGRG